MHARLSKLAPRRRKQLFWAAGLLAAYLLIGFFVVPAIIKWQLQKQLPGITKRQAAVKQVKFNPLTLSLTIRGLSLDEPDGRRFASFDEFYVNFQTSSLFRWAWTFKEIRLDRPFAEIILFKDGRLNLANMLAAGEKPAPAEPQTEKGTIPRIKIFDLQLTNGFVVIEDQMRRSTFRTEYRPINFRLTGFSTRPDAATPYSFRAESDAGRSVSWKGDFSVQPLKSAGDLEVLGVRLDRFQPYLDDFTTARLTNGIMDVHLSYSFFTDTNGLELTVTNGGVRVSHVDILDPQTSERVAGFDQFAVNGMEMSLRQRSARVGDISVSDLALLGRINPEGTINLLGLLTPREKTEPTPTGTNASPAQPWTVALDHFSLTNAQVMFEDLSKKTPFKTDLKPISLDLKSLSTATNTSGTYAFELLTESNEKVSAAGSISVAPQTSEGTVTLEALDLKKYMPYAEEAFAGHLAGGKLDLKAPYRLALGATGIRAGVSNLALTLTGLNVISPDKKESVARFDRVDVEGVEASLEDSKAGIGLIKARGGSILARQAKDGSINLMDLIKEAASTNATASAAPAISEPPAPPPSTNSPKWMLNLAEFDLAGYTIQFEDQKPARPATTVLKDVAVNLKHASSDLSAPVAAKLGFKHGESGVVDLSANARLEPLSADVSLGITNIDLRTIQPYLEQHVGLKITSGLLSTWGKAKHDPATSSFSGDVRVAKLDCTDTVVSKPFVSWEDLHVAGIAAEFPKEAQGRIKIDAIRWTEPHAILVLDPEGNPNLPKMVQSTASAPSSGSTTNPPAPAPPETSPKSSEPLPIAVGVFALENASFGFQDLSIKPNAAIAIEKLTGDIKGLSSALNTTADVNLVGTVGERSPFVVMGRINPLASEMFVDLVISNANTQLTPFTGYMEKYVGHPLNKGRLGTTLHYVVKGKELKAENKIIVDQLTLGARNNSPDATSLPVKLGIALLKDVNGTISLDVPLSGRLDDPQFKLGPIILKVVMNMLVKAAASPFKLLGALVGGGEELSFVQFNPGSSDPATGEIDKLEKLTKALAARPALGVEIEGQVDLSADRKALALATLKDQVRAARIDELEKKSKKADVPEDFQVEPEEYERILRTMFVEKFGTNVMAVLQSNLVASAQQAKADAASKASQERGVRKVLHSTYKTLTSLTGFGPSRSPAEKRLTREEREALAQATPELMEQVLADHTITVTPEEYRALVTARAEWVQKWLLENGNVAADRLMLVSPKEIGEGYQGSNRVTFSLN